MILSSFAHARKRVAAKFYFSFLICFMRILGVETTCDETGAALLLINPKKQNTRNKKMNPNVFKTTTFQVLANEIASQIKIHQPYGGVVPSLAAREHERNLPLILEKILQQTTKKLRSSKFKIRSSSLAEFDRLYVNPRHYPHTFAASNAADTFDGAASTFDYIALATGPGLAPALIRGKQFVQKLARETGTPIIPVNHLVAHLYSPLIPPRWGLRFGIWKLPETSFPAVGLIVSGGHTMLLRMDDLFRWQQLGETRDDAIGEAFDKVARLLGLPYPGGPHLERYATRGNPDAFSFPRPMTKQKNLDFSFSGLKTAVVYLIDRLGGIETLNEKTKRNIAASFQEAAVDTIIHKTANALSATHARTLLVGGGVAANKSLARKLKKLCTKKVRLMIADRTLATDNGLTIAFAGYLMLAKESRVLVPDELDIHPNEKI